MSSETAAAVAEAEDDEEDLEKLQAEIAKMEAEAARIAQETEDLEKEKQPTKQPSSAGGDKSASVKVTGNNGQDAANAAAETAKRDGLSIYVGQVDYSATPEELLAHFEPCGTVERVTIVCDKFTGRPKGYAYLEFQTEEAVENATKLDGSTFKERQLKVTHKRVNDPNFFVQGRGDGGRGRGGYGRGGAFRGGGRGGFRGGYPGGFSSRGRGRGFPRGGGRGGGGYGYHPYY